MASTAPDLLPGPSELAKTLQKSQAAPREEKQRTPVSEMTPADLYKSAPPSFTSATGFFGYEKQQGGIRVRIGNQRVIVRREHASDFFPFVMALADALFEGQDE